MQHGDPRRRVNWPAWCVGCVMLLAGCQSVPPAETVYRARPADNVASPARPRLLPPVAVDGAVAVTNASDEPAEKKPRPIPISLDTVLRLAQDQNGQVRIARLRLDDAENDQQAVRKHWFPEISMGMTTARHDGGIQDFQGNLLQTHYSSTLAGIEFSGKYDWKEQLYRRVEAERRVWQQKGELSKLTSENLLEACSTYISLLAARDGIVVSLKTEDGLKKLLEQSQKLAKVDNGLQVEVSGIERELMAQTVLTVKLREAGKGAAAKLAYLVGLDPCCEFLVADSRLAPIHLVNANQPVHKLVDQALTLGPGVRELEGLLRSVEAARDANYGLSHWLPTVELNLVEGGFGASPGAQSYNWANRFDVGVRLRYNFSEIAVSKQKRRQADSTIEQVHLSVQDLRAKLTLGVQEARDAIHSGIEQVALAEKHIQYAEKSHELSETRFEKRIKGASSTEVLVALRSLGAARLERLQAVRDLNRAQLRLFVLVGAREADGAK